MQTVGVAASKHQSSGKFIDDNNLIVTDNIIHITLHNAMCTDCLIDMMLQRGIFRIGQIIHMEICLCLFLSVRAEHSGVRLFVHNIVRTQLRQNFLVVL